MGSYGVLSWVRAASKLGCHPLFKVFQVQKEVVHVDVMVVADDVEVACAREAIEQRDFPEIALEQMRRVRAATALPFRWTFDHHDTIGGLVLDRRHCCVGEECEVRRVPAPCLRDPATPGFMER